MQLWIRGALSALMLAAALQAGPVDFGKAELKAALDARKLKVRVDTELSVGPPETFSIVLYKSGLVRVSGGDLRGLMYGLIEASEQIRSTGRFKAVTGKPATEARGVRMVLQPSDLLAPWFTSDQHWQSYFQTLARSRFNRLTLALPLKSVDIERFQILSETASDYGVDLVLGIRELQGEATEVYARLRGILDNCPLIRATEVQVAGEPREFFQEGVFPAIRESGRRVTLDLRGVAGRQDLMHRAMQAGIPLSEAGFEMLVHGPYTDQQQTQYWIQGRQSYDPRVQASK